MMYPNFLLKGSRMEFDLHSNLAEKFFVTDLPLCRVLLENNKHYPWLFLVPRQPNISRLIDLPFSDQILLLKEMDFTQKIMWEEFKPFQLNVAAIGNKIPQLHVHIIARYKNDPSWPNTVWDHSVRSTYDELTVNSILARLEFLFSFYQPS